MTERIGPYRVYERLGVGGMGEVFKAYDDRLDRWVAIKRIRPDRLDAEDNRERFKREARATARLNHPSIVHLYGIFQDDEDADCIVMEFVDGRTLDTFLSEGPLEPARVARLGHEIASGLAEAHANGILHRDLKAENIMITPRGRAKILDFGLAKPILSSELDPVLTSKGQLVGTSRAMSPEYVSGEDVDHRSDLFALGVLLYECLTGQSPFKAHNTLATLKQVMLHKQSPVRSLNPDVPLELSDLIDRLLSKDPKDRPQSAEEVALAFGRVTGQISSGIIDTPSFGSGSHPQTGGSTSTITASDTVLDLRPRNRRLAVLAILLVALVGAFVLGRLFVGKQTSTDPDLPPDERIHIVLAEFADNAEEDMLAASLTEAFRAVLEQSRSNTVLSHSQIQNALSRMQLPPETEVTRDIGIEICQREGAERLVAGTLGRIGKNFSIVINVVDPKGDRNTLSLTRSAQGEDQLLPAIEQLAQKVRAHLGESAADIERTVPLEKVTTSNLDALKVYTAGQNHVALGNNQAAIGFFERAVALDPSFAMAYAKLGVAFANIGETSEAVDSFKQALRLEEGLSELQKLYLKGWLARWEGSPEEVISNFSLMAEIYPENYIANYNLGIALWLYRNDFTEAVSALQRAASAARGPEKDLVLARLGICLVGLERFDAAREALSATEHPARAQGLLPIYLLEKNEAGVAELFSEISPAENHLYQALIRAYQGEFKEASAFLELAERTAIARSESQLLMQILADRAALAYLTGDRRMLSETAKKSLEFPFASAQGSRSALSLFVAKMLLRASQDPESLEEFELLSDPPEKTRAQTTEAFYISLEAELAISNGETKIALERAETANALADSVQLMETLATARGATKDSEGAMQLLERLKQRRGLSAVDCTSACLGRLYSLLLPRLVDQAGPENLVGTGHKFFPWPRIAASLQEEDDRSL